MTPTFRSKIDLWLGFVLAVAVMIELGVGSMFLANPPGSREAGLLIAAGCFALPGFIAWIVLGTRYEIGDGTLLALSGPFRFRVPLDDIRAVRPTRNPLSAPACSLDRLQIDYDVLGRSRCLLVSPKDKVGFLQALQVAVPGSRIEGDRLVTQG